MTESVTDPQNRDAKPDPTEPSYRRRKDKRPGEILAAAAEEFAEHGFLPAKMSRIAKRAGVSRATLYVYFEDKDALFDAVAEVEMGRFVKETSALAQSFDGTTQELLRQIFSQFYALAQSPRHGAILRVLVAEGNRSPELAARYHDAVMSRGKAAMAGVLARGVARGEVRPGAVTETPEVLIGPALHFVLNRMIFDHVAPLDPDRFLAAHLELVMRGIGTTD